MSNIQLEYYIQSRTYDRNFSRLKSNAYFMYQGNVNSICMQMHKRMTGTILRYMLDWCHVVLLAWRNQYLLYLSVNEERCVSTRTICSIVEQTANTRRQIDWRDVPGKLIVKSPALLRWVWREVLWFAATILVCIGTCKGFECWPQRDAGRACANNLSSNTGRVWKQTFTVQTEYFVIPGDCAEIAMTKSVNRYSIRTPQWACRIRCLSDWNTTLMCCSTCHSS
jgi:hypothetical protein